ncbi:GIY-YIG nuclease family protein [Naasia sp. SYSU D00057]|uniref:GIY-YIG nuclease family protein n=1 Tax=Naasia sp. SYSU D00057 TaxID=2817380 RepID=UPI001B305C2C|nr:GIY-YIG nuclease family protein [Naasia sp. SYSU D00057]
MPWMYLLQCADASYYAGSTWDLAKRLEEHQAGSGSSFTAARRPVELVYATEFERIEDAFAFEKRVQGWSRAKRQALIAGEWDQLPNLARRGFRPKVERPDSSNPEFHWRR